MNRKVKNRNPKFARVQTTKPAQDGRQDEAGWPLHYTNPGEANHRKSSNKGRAVVVHIIYKGTTRRDETMCRLAAPSSPTDVEEIHNPIPVGRE